MRDVPALLRPGQFVSLALAIVCGLYQVLRRDHGVDAVDAAEVTIASFFLIRVLAVYFNWQTQPVSRELPAAGERE